MQNVTQLNASKAAAAPAGEQGKSALTWAKENRMIIGVVVAAVVGLYLVERFGKREGGKAAA